MGRENLFEAVLACFRECDPWRKSGAVKALHEHWCQGRVELGTPRGDPGRVPGRPERPQLVPPQAVHFRSVATREGRAALLHAIAHIEFNAINLALDAILRFPGLPEDFHGGWLQVAAEEASHFEMVCEHMEATCQCRYGDLPAHDGLWEMAVRTAHDPLARMALVPRLFEARGLDATPAIMRKFQGIGDRRAVEILKIILAEEVGHVALGDTWFRRLCAARGLEPEATFQTLLRDYDAPRPRRPFNEEARRAAGFSEAELARFQ